MAGCPYGGGVHLYRWMRPAGSHTQRTPPYIIETHRHEETYRYVPSVCVRNVRLLANRKRAYLIISVAYNIYNILVRNGIYKIYNICHPPHTRRLWRLKNTMPPRIYTATAHTAATLPRCSAYRWTPPGHLGTHREKPPGCSERERREIVRYKAL